MIHTRDQLLDWLSANVGDPVLSKAISDGQVEVLGGFAPLPTSANSGMLVELTTEFGTRYLIAVAEDRKRIGRFYWFRAPFVSWPDWIGDRSVGQLFQGDRPDVYTDYKAERLRLARYGGGDSIHPVSNRRYDNIRAASGLDCDRPDQDV